MSLLLVERWVWGPYRYTTNEDSRFRQRIARSPAWADRARPMRRTMLSGRLRGLEEIVGEALQHATGFVDRHFFRGIQAAGHRHVDAFTIATVDHQRERRARRPLADHVVSLG